MRDLLIEAWADVQARPRRTVLGALGVTVGIATVVATVGLASTAGAHIVSRFDELAATEVMVVPAADDGPQDAGSAIPWDAPQRLGRLNGVSAAANMSTLELTEQPVRSTTAVDPLTPDDAYPPVVAASPGLLAAVRGGLSEGRWFDSGHSDRADHVAVVGSRLADRLHLADVTQLPALFIGEQAFTVIEVVDEVERSPALLDSVIIPDGAARAAFGLAAPQSVLVETQIGAAPLIASQAPTALSPQDPDALLAQRAAEPAGTRARVAADVQGLLLVLAGISLLIGVVGIANTTLVSVMERIGEIGLRRALGGTRRSVAGLFLLESALVGLLGGLLGASAGVLTVVGVGAARHWSPVMEVTLAPAGAVLGVVVGLLAGLYPSWRASQVEPIAALRANL